MASNTSPIAIAKAKIQRGDASLTTANANLDGTGAGMVVAFTADAVNTSICHYLMLKPYGNAAATTQTPLRIFINDGLGLLASNFMFIKSLLLSASSEFNNTVSQDVIVPLNILLPPGYKVMCCIATASTTPWQVTGFGGDT